MSYCIEKQPDPGSKTGSNSNKLEYKYFNEYI